MTHLLINLCNEKVLDIAQLRRHRRPDHTNNKDSGRIRQRVAATCERRRTTRANDIGPQGTNVSGIRLFLNIGAGTPKRACKKWSQRL